jgi:hypothetical protein
MKSRRNKNKKTKRTRNKRRTKRGGATLEPVPAQSSFFSNPVGAISSGLSSAANGIGSVASGFGTVASGAGSTLFGSPAVPSTAAPSTSKGVIDNDSFNPSRTPLKVTVNGKSNVKSSTSINHSNGENNNRGSNFTSVSRNNVQYSENLSNSRTVNRSNQPRPPSLPPPLSSYSEKDMEGLVERVGVKGEDATILEIALYTARKMMKERKLLPCESRVANKSYLNAIIKRLKEGNTNISVAELEEFALIARDDGPPAKSNITLEDAINFVISNSQKIIKTKDNIMDDECIDVIKGIIVLLKRIKTGLGIISKETLPPVQKPPDKKNLYDPENINSYETQYKAYEQSGKGMPGFKTYTGKRPEYYPITKEAKRRYANLGIPKFKQGTSI